MTKELEALLTELYVLIDDQVVEPRHGRGRRPELSDSELLCLAVAQMLWVSTVNDDGSGTPKGTPTCGRCSPTCLPNPGTTRG